MASTSVITNKNLHFILFPLFAQGHMIPMIDMAKLIAERGFHVSLITTSHNASRFESALQREKTSRCLPIQLVKLPFPSREVGLPEGYENLDILPSKNLLKKFYDGLDLLQKPLEDFLHQQERNHLPPSCIVSDKCLYWTAETARKFDIPRIVFHGMNCFSLLAAHNIRLHNAHLSVDSDSEPFIVPGMPQRFEVTRQQLPGSFVSIADMDDVRDKMRDSETTAFCVIVNSFEEIEHGCADAYKKALGKKVWCIGPVSLFNKSNIDNFDRGNKSSINMSHCLEWLNKMKPKSVIYVSLGSLCRLVTPQLIELALGLEASNRPFVWAVKPSIDLEKWLTQTNFEERIKGRGLLIKGWAPQVLILSHVAIGGFLTHCGWNSTIEGVCAGLPMVTWPLFAEQFLNEKMVVEILRIGVRVGVEVPVRWGDEERVGVLVKKERVERVVNELMDYGGGDDNEGELRRERAMKLGEKARAAMEIGGSSYLNMSILIDDVLETLKCN